MTFIRVDIERLRAETLAAEHRLGQAVDRRKEAEAVLQNAVDEETHLRQQAEFARLVEERVIAAAEDPTPSANRRVTENVEPTEANGAVHSTPADPEVVVEAIEQNGDKPPVDSFISEGPYTSLSTRQAILDALRSNAGRTFALDELVTFMKERGYTGTHNAVHVQLSRLMGSPEAPDLHRPKQGYYRSKSGDDPTEDGRPGRAGDISTVDLRRQSRGVA